MREVKGASHLTPDRHLTDSSMMKTIWNVCFVTGAGVGLGLTVASCVVGATSASGEGVPVAGGASRGAVVGVGGFAGAGCDDWHVLRINAAARNKTI